ncbi:MAG: hypothetical protein LBL33_01390, partial [Tannerella sp.]|nr:hypothetical protein [Tannerella sp.]
MSENKYKGAMIFLFMAICYACTGSYEANRLMNEAELLLAANPDSSRSLLDDAEFLIQGDRDFARWCLLSGKTEDEMRKIRKPKPLLSVSQWLRAEAYYDRRGTPEEKAQIKMYLGRSLCDDGRYDDAVAVYKEGLDFARKAEAYSLAGYLCSFMGDLYLDQGNRTKMIHCVKRVIFVGMKTSNYFSEVSDPRVTGRCLH